MKTMLLLSKGKYMKKIVMLLVVLVLSGCTTVENKMKKIENLVNELEYSTYQISNNNFKEYYNYYIGINNDSISNDEFNNTIRTDKIIVNQNINVNGILYEYHNEEDYTLDSISKINKPVYSDKSSYLDNYEKEIPYLLEIYNKGDKYYLFLQTSQVIFDGLFYLSELDDVLKIIFVTAKSLVVNEEKLISKFSLEDTIEIQRENVDLFKGVVPVNGPLTEILKGSVEKDKKKEDLIDVITPILENNQIKE